MSYININEVDKTISDLSPITNDNIVYIPINSTDGPSGVYNVLQSYTDFVNMYGSDPNPNSVVMTSWDYAANLLLRNMPVMVRRITNYVDEDGNDKPLVKGDEKSGLLPGASRAKGILKIADVAGVGSISPVDKFVEEDLTYTPQQGTKPIVIPKNANTSLTFTTDSDLRYLSLDLTSTDLTSSEVTSKNASTTGTISSSVSHTGYSLLTSAVDMEITFLGISGLSEVLYVASLENLTVTSSNPTAADLPDDSRLQFVKDDGSIVPKTSISLKKIEEGTDDKKYMLILPAGVSIKFKSDDVVAFSVAFNSKKANFIQYKNYVNSNGYTVTTIGTEADDELSFGVAYKAGSEEESADNPPAIDAKGNINLFKLAYKNVGSNGSRISVGLKNIANDGIYLQVWNSTQRLENIQLVNYRYKTSNNRYATYDPIKDKEIIWKQLIANFGITLPVKSQKDATNLMTTNYIALQLNPMLDWNNPDFYDLYLNDIYKQTGMELSKLSGGSSPSDEHVTHEVQYTYAPLKDKYLYDVKFISNGGYTDKIRKPVTVSEIPEAEYRYITDAQIDLAESRGDCLAFVDVPFEISREDTLDYFQYLSTSYATCYAPWIRINLLTRQTKWCPPSFAALWTIAKSVGRGNKVYAPPAGVNRANIPECADLAYQIPSEYIDSWQDNHCQFINPIIYINGYGVNIFGQKTLYSRVDGSYDTKSALQFLNTRLVANEVKKRIFKSCIELTFEQNNLHTWLAFKTKMSTLLDTLLYDKAITYYDIQMDENTMSDADIQANHIVGIVSIACSTTAEKFDITFELLPNQVNFLDIDYSVDNATDAYGSQG